MSKINKCSEEEWEKYLSKVRGNNLLLNATEKQLEEFHKVMMKYINKEFNL